MDNITDYNIIVSIQERISIHLEREKKTEQAREETKDCQFDYFIIKE